MPLVFVYVKMSVVGGGWMGKPGLAMHFTCLCPFALVIWTYTKYPSVCVIHVEEHCTLLSSPFFSVSHLLLVLKRLFCPPQWS